MVEIKKHESNEKQFEIILVNDEEGITSKEADTQCGIDYYDCGYNQNDVCMIDFA